MEIGGNRMKDRPYYKTKLKRGPKPVAGIEWPFRINGDYIEQFNQRSKIWITPSGSPDRVGYIMLTWKAPNGRMYKPIGTLGNVGPFPALPWP